MFKTKKKKQEEKQKKMEEFFAEYRELAHKHGFDFYASLQVTDKGIIPIINVREITNEAGGSKVQ